MAARLTFALLLPATLAAAPTFHKDVEPLLQKHCQGCHRPGEAAPFSLLTYKDSRPWAKAIRAAVTTRKMPPWFADPTHGNFANAPRLSPNDIQTRQAWADAGAPAGNPADAPPPLKFADGWKIGTPDLIVEIPSAYPIPAKGTIPYIWLAADPKLTEDRWIEKIEVRPGERSVVHHALVFARHPNSKFRPDLQPGDAKPAVEPARTSDRPQSSRGAFLLGGGGNAEMIVDYVPNGDPFIAPPNHARLLPAGSHILFQMHYTAMGRETTDRTRIGIVFAKNKPTHRIVNDAILNTSIRIPPGAPDHAAEAIVTIHHDTKIGAFGPHMHVRGKAMKAELLREGAAPVTLLDVPNYDFNWQLKYQPAGFVDVRKGDQLKITARWDNSPNNKYNPNPAKEVFWGDQSWSEMLFWFFDYVVPVDVPPSAVTRPLRAQRN